MKLHFDPNQTFQLDAVSAVVELFDGQPVGQPEFAVIRAGAEQGLFAGQERSELGIGNRLLLDAAKLHANVRATQARNDIEVSNDGRELEAWEILDSAANAVRSCPHFSVEMETGTGKTYVYLRTIFELSKRYGFQKFIIVVPSVAIREGVLKNIDITTDHFRSIYNNLPFEHFVYDARRVNRLRQFATGNTLQILVINIDAFRKNFTGTEVEQRSNVIYKESDKLSGRQPIEYVQAARPIVIIDEPQSVDSTDRAQEAIKALNPLCTLRYSATHKNLYNLVYRLDPVRAFELGLVKQIVVASAVTEESANEPFVRVESIDYKPGIKAKLRIHVQAADGVKEKTVTAKNGADLYRLSNERAVYAQGYSVAEISAEPGAEFVRFNNGKTLAVGDEIGGLRDDIWKVQLRHTIKKHLEKELQVQARGIKVLSLFFIDRVANYRDYDEDGRPTPGKFARLFEEELAALAKEERYSGLAWLQEPFERLHNGYFASDKKGVYKDTKGDTQADDDVYSLIMREKERLLSTEEPLRFIFSHSALREGWDNPNVFQICTLNETRSVLKKRQEIGRGLRLPVDQNGHRVRDEAINKLYVMANESYEDFARALQTEYEEDCGVTFGKVPLTAIARLVREVDGVGVPIGKDAAEAIRSALVGAGMLTDDGKIGAAFKPNTPGFSLLLPEAYADLRAAVTDLLGSHQIERHIKRERDERANRLRKEVMLSPEFTALWNRIKPRTNYRVEFDTEELAAKAVAAIKRMEKIEAPKIRVTAGQIVAIKEGVRAAAISAAEERADYAGRPLPDILAYLQNETELTRSTLARILNSSGRLGDCFLNPQRFLDQVASILKHELHKLLVDGIKYEKVEGDGVEANWEMLRFKHEELVNLLSAEKVGKSVYDYVEYDSEVEREFARKLDQRDDIKLFMKLPRWFVIDTPVGKYNPDWAIVKQESATIYLVRETKSTRNFLKLRTGEADKVRCGLRHFEALDVPFAVAVSADEV
ncbi:MAG: DEAD/DEAH box helicase family protein [Hyphomonadaceae bacterium]